MAVTTYEDLLDTYRSQYRAAGNGFHPQQIAGDIDAALDKLRQLAVTADGLLTPSSSGPPSRAAAQSVMLLVDARIQALGSLFARAAEQDAALIRQRALIDQSGLQRQAAVQQRADAALFANLQSWRAALSEALVTATARARGTPLPREVAALARSLGIDPLQTAREQLADINEILTDAARQGQA